LVTAKKVKATVLCAATLTATAFAKVFTPTYYFDKLTVLGANPDFLPSSSKDEVNLLKESFDDVKRQPFAAMDNSILIPTAGYETVDGVRMSQPFFSP
jgi:hypothetical protein